MHRLVSRCTPMDSGLISPLQSALLLIMRPLHRLDSAAQDVSPACEVSQSAEHVSQSKSKPK